MHFFAQSTTDTLQATSTGRWQGIGLQRYGTAMTSKANGFGIVRFVRLKDFNPVSLILWCFRSQIPYILSNRNIEPAFVKFVWLQNKFEIKKLTRLIGYMNLVCLHLNWLRYHPKWIWTQGQEFDSFVYHFTAILAAMELYIPTCSPADACNAQDVIKCLYAYYCAMSHAEGVVKHHRFRLSTIDCEPPNVRSSRCEIYIR